MSEAFLEWLRRQRHRVFRTASSYWYDIAPRIYQAIPYHTRIQPPEAELRHFIKRSGAIGLRYSAPLTAQYGAVSYHVILADKDYDIQGLHKKARHDVRRGLGHADMQPIPLERLAREGWALRRDTLARQRRVGAENEAGWRTLCLSAEGLSGFEAWGAIHEGQLVAALLAFTDASCCSILYQQSLTEHLDSGVNNALAYEFARHALGRFEVSRVFYGLHSLDAPDSVDRFKLRMGYIAEPVRQRVVFNPFVAPLANTTVHAILKSLRNRRPEHTALAKAEGMMRFYLEGNRPLALQSWPDVLVDRRAEVLESLPRT